MSLVLRSFAALAVAALGSGAAAGDFQRVAPRPLAPELDASTEHTAPGALAADGAMLYLTRSALDFSRARILVSRRSASGWSAPEPLFDAGHTDSGPALAPDGTKLYLHSNRATGLDGIADEWNLFVTDRSESSWSEPKALPAPLNSAKSECCVAAAPDGSLYFASDRHGSWDLWRAIPESAPGGGAAWRLEKLPEGINSSYMEWPSAIDLLDVAGERVERLLFSSIRRGGAGGDDLYVAFRREGAWHEPHSLGPIVNTSGYEDSPRVAPDGTFLYATRGEQGVSSIHAVAASTLDLLPELSAEAALNAADEALGRAWSARDVDGMMALYAPEATAHWSGEPPRDRAGIRATIERNFADPGYGIDGRELGRWVSAAADLAVLQGESTIQRGTGAARTSRFGTWSLVWSRIGGDWKVVLESFVEGGLPSPELDPADASPDRSAGRERIEHALEPESREIAHTPGGKLGDALPDE